MSSFLRQFIQASIQNFSDTWWSCIQIVPRLPAPDKLAALGCAANMPFQRYIIRNLKELVMNWSRHIYGRTGSPRVYRLSKTVAVKFCSKARSHEAETM
jgi:hypothetical protein